LHSPGDAAYSDAIVADRTQDPGNVSSVAVIIVRIASVVDCVNSMDVVNDSVVIIINTIALDFAGIGP